ncbi:calcium-binding protein [Aestuariivirga sp.]|uniref:calcium-binding protein n=1 Tax=Aestuariivirga sp. TaxID=2650926 RepID=UPI00391C416F
MTEHEFLMNIAGEGQALGDLMLLQGTTAVPKDPWGGPTTISGDDSDNTLYGDEGSNNIYGYGGNDTIWASTGLDRIYGGDGNDYLSWREVGASDGYGNDYYGEDGNDTVVAGPGNDGLYGGAGNDSLSGSGGNDYCKGASGNDTLDGGNGDDNLMGDWGSDTIYGGFGNDTIVGGISRDILAGEFGADTYHWRRGDGNDIIYELIDGASDVLFFESGIKRKDVKVRMNPGVNVTYTIKGQNGGVITLRGGGDLLLKYADEAPVVASSGNY